jgi:hypothetical protein
LLSTGLPEISSLSSVREIGRRKRLSGIGLTDCKGVSLPFGEAEEKGELCNAFAPTRISRLMIKLKQSRRPKDQIDLFYLLQINDQDDLD